MKSWLVAHHMTLMTIADTPHSIALGSAIVIFFGFTPLYPLKTLLSIAVAWVFRCNKVAAAIAVTLHDVLIWAMPAIYVAEYHSRVLEPSVSGGSTRAFSPVWFEAITCTGTYFLASSGLFSGPLLLVRSSWPFPPRSLFIFSCAC